jgi:uncharacterized protein (DUF433 family)
MKTFDRITIDPERLNGQPCIRDLRITVKRVLEALATYPDRAELKREYPELEDEDIEQALGCSLRGDSGNKVCTSQRYFGPS